jgi:hypothetical protein
MIYRFKISAEAGIQVSFPQYWIPVFTGMTEIFYITHLA